MLRSPYYQEGELTMDHNAVVRQKMTERYLLDELDSTVRDEFEEHFFDCPECALDVRAGAQFVAESKTVLAECPEQVPVATVGPRRNAQGWLAWLRPAFAAPVFALLLAVIGYQNLVIYPKLQAGRNQPQVLPWAAVAVGTWGAGGPAIPLSEGQGFLLFVRIPPDGVYTRYTADLYNPAGKLEWTLTIPAVAGQDQWPVQVPGAHREAGTYTMVVHGLTAAGENKDLGKTSFDLQIQQ